MSYEQSQARAWFLESMSLPVQGLESIRPLLEQHGATIGDPLPDDPLFVACSLPNGWRVEIGDRPTSVLIVDQSGRVRGEVFYRVDPVERVATVRPEPRFCVRLDARAALRNEAAAVVFDDGQPVFETAPILFAPRNSAERYFADEMSILSARRWLDMNYPGWRQDGGKPGILAGEYRSSRVLSRGVRAATSAAVAT